MYSLQDYKESNYEMAYENECKCWFSFDQKIMVFFYVASCFEIEK